MEVDADEYQRLLRNQQEQATTAARLQFELEAHLKESLVSTEDFKTYVMDPKEGTVVRADRMDVRADKIEAAMMRRAIDINKIPDLEKRIKAMEDAHTERARQRSQEIREAEAAHKESKQWTWRQVIVPALMSVLVAVVVALLTAQLLR